MNKEQADELIKELDDIFLLLGSGRHGRKAILNFLRKAYENGYQDGLYDGLIAAHKNSDGRIALPEQPEQPEQADYDATIDSLMISHRRM